MADDDNEIEEAEEELDEDDLDVEPDDDLDDDDVVVEVDDELDDDDADDDDEEDEDDDDKAARARKRKGADDDDDDDDMLAPDDVEADLDTILKDRMVTVDEDEDDDDDDDDKSVPVAERGEAVDGIQPKRADEMLCTSCFLLVRPNAPGCPVEDDDCPIFN